MRVPRIGGRSSLLVHVLVVLNLSNENVCHGRQGFRRPFGLLRIRGGEESRSGPSDQNQHHQYHGYRDSDPSRTNLPDLPGEDDPFSSQANGHSQQQQQQQHETQDQYSNHPNDDPNYHNAVYSSQQHYQEPPSNQYYNQHDMYQPQQQSQQGPPPLPPGAYGDGDFEDITAPPLPGGYDSQMDPRFAGPPPPMDDASLFQDGPLDDPDSAAGATFGMDSSSDSSGMDLSSFDKEYILKGLARLYRKKILPLEISSRYGHFHSPPLSPADFVAPPMVLLLGQYRYVQQKGTRKLLGGMAANYGLTIHLLDWQCWKDIFHQVSGRPRLSRYPGRARTHHRSIHSRVVGKQR
jgi:N-terminal EH-domain containing protein